MTLIHIIWIWDIFIQQTVVEIIIYGATVILLSEEMI